jgi:alkanesulfonate monooxygenase SsuD/methylene tetrahydromethanopterin reductase-like flavin-dependent oxidoreductase (luciferase family)
MDIDIVLDSHLAPEEAARLGLLAEKHGIRCIWNASYQDGRDPFSNLTELAKQSSTIKIAPMALNAYEMHPFRIAMALLTLNEIADGRVEAMIGGGGEVVMSLGIPFDKRVRYVRECLELVKGATRNRPFTYKGELFSIENYDPQWVTAEPPFLYSAANKPQMLRMAATTADGIFMSDLSVGLAENAIKAVKARQAEAGIDASGFRYNNFMAWYVYDDPKEARFEARRWIGFRALFRDYMMREFVSDEEFQILLDHMPEIYGMAPKGVDSVDGIPDELLDRCVDHLTLTGGMDDLDSIIEHLLEYKALGVTEICMELKNHQEQGIKLLGERVIPALK